MNQTDLARWLAGHRKPAPARVVAIVDGREQPLSIQAGTGRWVNAAKLVFQLNAEGVRLFDREDKLLDSCSLDTPIGGDATDVAPSSSMAPSSPAASGAGLIQISLGELARLLSQVQTSTAETIRAVARDVSQAQTAAHSSAFKELTRVTEIATSRLIACEEFVQHSLAERAERLEQREELIEQRETQVRTEEEAEGVLDKIMEKVGPEIAEKLTTKLVRTNGVMTSGTNGVGHGKKD
jgi:hypothetical protein